MNLPFKIARRYFFSRKGQGSFNLITIISSISLLGYITGAAALIIVLSVFNGFEGLFTSLYNNFDADIQITATSGKSFDERNINFGKLAATPGVQLYSKVLEENVLLRYNERQSIATAKGVDEHYLDLTSLDSCIITGDKLLTYRGNSYTLVGQGIAYKLGVDPADAFSRIAFYVPGREAVSTTTDLAGSFNQDALYPSGTFSVQQEVDDKYVLTPLSFVKSLIDKPNDLSSIEIRIKPDAETDDVIASLKEQFPDDRFTIKNRFEQREAFFKVMRSEKLISYFILFFILLIAASNTIGSLYILVVEKKKDIGMLSGMGLNRSLTGRIFIYEGMLQAFTGGLTGLCIGLLLCYLQQQYGFVKLNETASFMFQTYPVEIAWKDIVLVMVTVLFLGSLTALYPAYKARQLSL